MALNIKNDAVDALARKLAARTGETITEAVLHALRERLARTENTRANSIRQELAMIRERCSKLKVQDPRAPEAIIGYDDAGAPK